MLTYDIGPMDARDALMYYLRQVDRGPLKPSITDGELAEIRTAFERISSKGWSGPTATINTSGEALEIAQGVNRLIDAQEKFVEAGRARRIAEAEAQARNSEDAVREALRAESAAEDAVTLAYNALADLTRRKNQAQFERTLSR